MMTECVVQLQAMKSLRFVSYTCKSLIEARSKVLYES